METQEQTFELYVPGTTSKVQRTAKLAGVNGEWIAKDCPVCGDANYHLYINPTKKQYFCQKCQKGSYLWNSSREIVATYDYTEEAGNLLFQCIRYADKHFSQRRPNGQEGWIWNLNGVRRVLYHLPEVIKADTVYIVEGEKDVENLRALGLIATCNPMGTASGWKEEYTPFLKDKDVIILPDCDEPGLKHSKNVAFNLKGIAKSLKMVQLFSEITPDHGKDVSDFLIDYKREDLLTLIDWYQEYEIEDIKISPIEQSSDKYELNFPKDSIQGLAKEFADLYSQYFETPWSFWAFNYLTILGSVLADKITIYAGNEPPPRLFTLILGSSGDARKSEGIKQALKFFNEALPLEFHYILNAGSDAGLMEALQVYPKLLLVYDEMKTFVDKTKIEGATLLTVVNSLFELERAERHIKGKSEVVENARLSLLTASTVDVYERMWQSQHKDIGFLNRLWLVPDKADRRFGTVGMINPTLKETLQKQTALLVGNIIKRKVYNISSEASMLFNNWYLNLDAPHSAHKSIHNKRIDTYGHRLMSLFCANEGKEEIDLDMMKRIIALLDWQRKVRYEYDVSGIDNQIARIEDLIRRSLRKHPMKKRELQQAIGASKYGTWNTNAAIENLKKDDQIIYDLRTKAFCIGKDAWE